jgi:uncharacterized protein
VAFQLSPKMKQVVEEQRLCFAATVCPDGSPNVSPKGTIMVWSESELAFFDLASPQTVENLEHDPRIELNVVDQRLRTGFRFRGTARVTNAAFDLMEARDRYARVPPAADRIHSLVIIEVTEARPLISPAYDVTDDPAQIAQQWEAYWLRLWRKQPEASDGR